MTYSFLRQSSVRLPQFWGIVATSICTLTALAADVTSYTDSFEEAAVGSFWTSNAQNGSITLPVTDRIHTGAQAVRFNATGGGQKELSLSHRFQQPRFGTVSTWVYDSGDYIYFNVTVGNSTVGPGTAGIGVQDWDGSAYYYGLFNNTGGKSGVARSRAWRQFTIKSTVSTLTLAVDGQEVYRGAGGQPFDTVTLRVSGPGGGTIWFDDFNFEVEPDPAPIQITSLSSVGLLQWTNLPALTNGLFTVEWAPAPGSNWQSSWNSLQSFPVMDATNAVNVPMIYRVRCLTNLLFPLAVGGRLSYQVTNAAGASWTEQMTCLGLTKPSAGAGKEFGTVEVIEAGQMSLQLMRSTAGALYRLDPNTLTEDLEFQVGPAGTTWTNHNYEGQMSLRVTVEAIETVVVPAGTFTGCYRFGKQPVGGGPNEYWQEWVAPGVGIVKWVDYWLDPEEYPPAVHVLESRSLVRP